MKLQKDDRFMPAFLKSAGYVKLLAELDLLKDSSKSDEEDTRSSDEVSLGEGSSLGSLDIDDINDSGPLLESKSSAVENPFRNATDCVITASISQKGNLIVSLSRILLWIHWDSLLFFCMIFLFCPILWLSKAIDETG